MDVGVLHLYLMSRSHVLNFECKPPQFLYLRGEWLQYAREFIDGLSGIGMTAQSETGGTAVALGLGGRRGVA